ncbi:cation-translocating P-type ATPase [Thiohalocapsa sp. ML1]|uniref:heavy metal translocating P-type ATPase n=1 Tax=Thiohalocapsa sp. ML1 TaxID=1431688 RepID=UPI0007322E14|nr:cation-translocating P-type ATPase [Thiohalocapsa sp. ML1]
MIEVRHSIPGRLRLGVPALRQDRQLADAIRTALGGMDGVVLVRINPACGSLLVGWRQADADGDERVAQVLEALLAQPLPRRHTQGARRRRAAPAADDATVACRACRTEPGTPADAAPRNPWPVRVLSFVLLTGWLGFALVREFVLKRPLASGALGPTGLIALVAAVPLLRDAWHETVVERRFTLHQFLAFSLLLAIGFGEAMTAFEIVYVLRGGRLLEQYVSERSRRAIRDMLALAVKDAWVLVDGAEVAVPVADLTRGARVVVRTGEKIPVDGRVEDGEGEVSEAVISGRAEPIYKTPGEHVFAGSYLEQGRLVIRAESVGDATYLARVAALVDASLDQKAPLEQRADVLAARLLKLGTVMTVATLVLTQSITRAFTVMLVMSCPCSTILAAATAVSAAIHNAARRQMLVKGGTALEHLAGARVWCFDKTGTLTTEQPEVAEVIADDVAGVIGWAASAELHNPHALAHAIVAHAAALGVAPRQHCTSEHILGHGVKATVDSHAVLLGNARLLDAEGIGTRRFRADAKRLHARGLTLVYVAVDGRLKGLLGIRHQLRPGVREMLARLRADGVEQIVLISGDAEAPALALAAELDLDACYAELLPEEKAHRVAALQAEHGEVVMVGDGVNDALALSGADIGIAMGAGGSEVAVEVADIAIADSDIRKLAALKALSRATLRTADQNYWLAIGTDAIGIVGGATGLLGPAVGGLIHIVHTVGILANSSRLLGHRPAARHHAGVDSASRRPTRAR